MKRGFWSVLIAGFFIHWVPDSCGDLPKWGKVDQAVLNMTAYPADTLADAVKIYDIGEMEVDLGEQFFVISKRHIQTKILKKSGFEKANIAIPYWHKDKITKIRAQAVFADGKKVAVKGDAIFDEMHGRWYRQKKLTVPSVGIGTVIEVEYELNSEYVVHLDPWVFQDDIPTLRSELTVKFYPGLVYNVMVANDRYGSIRMEEESYIDPDRLGENLTMYRYRAENMPAIRMEPFVTCLADYHAMVVLQIHSYKGVHGEFNFIKDMKTLCKELFEGPFGTFLKPTDRVQKLVQTLVRTGDTPVQKAARLYGYVRDNLDDESYGGSIYPDKTQDEILEKKKASDSERNGLLMSMLSAANLTARPVLISTRSHGRVDLGIPILQQYDKTIVSFQNQTQRWLMDAGGRYIPFGRLPSQDLVGAGLEITKDGSSVVAIPNEGFLSTQEFKSTIRVSEDGSAAGEARWSCTGYAGSKKNEKLDQTKDPAKFISDELNAAGNGIEVTATDPNLCSAHSDTFSSKFTYKIKDAVERIQNELFLNPVRFSGLKKNILVSEKREYPIDINYREQVVETNTFEFPSGTVLAEVPKDFTLTTPGVSYSMKYQLISANPLRLICTRTYQLKTLNMPAAQYKDLKNSFAQIVDADQGQIVLKSNR